MVEVAPEISLKVFPPSVLTCHCTVSVPLGLRLAAVKVAVLPATTIWFCGCVVTESTVNVAAVVVSVPVEFVKTARYSSPFSVPSAVKL